MKEIDEYLKLLYKHINADDQEIKNLKEEMKNHLQESVNELQAEGRSMQESIRIAIERFGDPAQINRELPKILMVSRRRFSRLLLIASGVALAVLIGFSFTFYDNVKKQEKLKQAELTRQTFLQELQQPQMSGQDFSRVLLKIADLTVAYNFDSGRLGKELDAEYNVSEINEIGEMNRTFKYHNGVLIAIAVIAADTDYECPYFKEIAELGVMKLSDSMDVIGLAEDAREAKTQSHKAHIENQIRQMKEGAEFKSYQEALDYNSKLAIR